MLNQFRIFSSPPPLEIYTPQDGQILKSNKTEIVGRTNYQAAVEIDGLPIELSKDGSFRHEVLLEEGEHTILIKATSRSGKVREVKRRVIVEKEEGQ